MKTYQGHKNQKYSLNGAFGVYGTLHSPTAFVCSGSEDGDIILWDVSSKNVLQRLQGHTGPVLSVDTHPTEPVIVSGGFDKTVKIWRCDEEYAVHHESDDMPQEDIHQDDEYERHDRDRTLLEMHDGILVGIEDVSSQHEEEPMDVDG